MADNYCSNCGENLNNAKFCPNCGTPVVQKGTQTEEQYFRTQSNAFNGTPPKQVKNKNLGCLVIALIIPIVLFVVLAYAGQSSFKDTASNHATTSQSSKVASVSPTGNSNDIVGAAIGITPENLLTVKDILNQCGVVPIKIKHDTLLDGYGNVGIKGYRIETNSVKNVCLYITPEETVSELRYSNDNMYENGKVVKTLDQIINQPDLELVGETKGVNNGYSLNIEGTIKNNTIMKYSYVQVTFGIYDNAGNKIGTAIDNINHLDKKEVWKFHAIGIVSGTGLKYKLDEISGF